MGRVGWRAWASQAGEIADDSGMGEWCRDVAGGAEVRVKVVPGASRDRIAGVLGDALKVQVAAAPERGKANAAVEALIADALGVARSAVTVVSGPTQPRKTIRVDGLTADEVIKRLGVG